MKAINKDNASQDRFIPPDYWKMLDVAQIEDWDCPPTKWIIEDIIAEGTFNIVAAASQTGKSLLWLHICAKLLMGGKLFDKFQINPVEKLLYLVLEDPVRRIKDRLAEVPNIKSIQRGRFNIYSAIDLNLTDDSCFNWLEDYIKEGEYNLIILDTYQKATPGLDSYKDEEQSKILHRLVNITRKLNITIVVLDHVRKPKNGWRNGRISLEDVKGTGGKVQNADCVILMQRYGQHSLFFSAQPKETDTHRSFMLDAKSKGAAGEKFTLVGNVDEVEKKTGRKDSEKLAVIQAEFAKQHVASVPDVARSLDLSPSTVGRCVPLLAKANVLKKIGQGRNTKYEYINQKETIN